MSYDFEDPNDTSPPKFNGNEVKSDPHDLEFITTLLEISAIYLSPYEGALFSFEELLKQAKDLIDGDPLYDVDVKIVLQNLHSIKKVGKLYKLN